MKRVYVSVSNDLVTDNRVAKTCQSLTNFGLEVFLIGRVKRNSPAMNSRSYKHKRMKLIFETGFLFYAELNIRLFLKLLLSKQDILWANDLDTLLANYLVSKIKNKPLIFDSHEHFTEVPELKYNKFAKKIWKKLEAFILPKLSNVITVCNPIAEYFRSNYNVNSTIVRNIPIKAKSFEYKSKKNLNIPQDKPMLIWQGSVNIERGLEELIEAMPLIDAYLYIIGDGDIVNQLKELSTKNDVQNKVFFVSKIPYNGMMQYTNNADLGLSFDKDTNQNYAISLPNKLFEYISANIPILISPLSEIKPIVETFMIGEFLYSHKPSDIANQINDLLSDKDKCISYKENCKKASNELCWENEEEKIFDIIKTL